MLGIIAFIIITTVIILVIYGDHTKQPPIRKYTNHGNWRPRTDTNPMEEDTGNQFMSAEEKETYLRSFKWHLISQQVKKRDEHRCQICDSLSPLSIHHIHYERLGDEKLEDLATLCQPCHEELHLLLGYDRKSRFENSRLRNQKILNDTSRLEGNNFMERKRIE